MPNSPNTHATEATDSEEERRKTKEYNRAYYEAHREHIVRKVTERTKLIRGSDAFRAKLLEDLNCGKRKFVKQNTRDLLNIQQDPKTMLWF
jgi:hypothetical protein